MDLTEHKLKGLGPKGLERLAEKEITTVEKVAVMRPSELVDIAKVNKKIAKEIVSQAKAIALDKAMEVKTAKQILDERMKTWQRIPTGSKRLDEILGGGICTNAVTGIAGKFATGKTQICHQAIINCKRYLKGKSAYIETEPQAFQPDRLLQMAKAQAVKLDLEEDVYAITCDFITNPARQFLAYEAIAKKIDKGMNIRLLVVDSWIMHFRTSEEYQGRENLPDRFYEEARHIGFLQHLSAKYNLAIVLTFQVAGASPDTGGALQAIKTYGIPHRVTGGPFPEHGVTFWITLDFISSRDKTWKAIVIDGPVPRADCLFRILESGVMDA